MYFVFPIAKKLRKILTNDFQDNLTTPCLVRQVSLKQLERVNRLAASEKKGRTKFLKKSDKSEDKRDFGEKRVKGLF